MKKPTGTVIEQQTVLESKSFAVSRERVHLPNGHETTIDVIRHPGACAIVAMLDDDHVVLLHQYRHAIGQWQLEVPAGKFDPGESPEQCAARELEEETGFRTETLESLGMIWPTPGFSDEKIYLFLCSDLQSGTQRLEPNEVVEVVSMPFTEALAAVSTGEIQDAKTIAALTLSAQRRPTADR